MRAKIRDGYIQSSGYGVIKKEDNLKDLHIEKNIFPILCDTLFFQLHIKMFVNS